MDIASVVKSGLDFLRWNLAALAACGVMLLLLVLFLVLFYAAPGCNIGVAQPISFSHQVHTGVKEIQCRFCHPYVDRSVFPGIPPVEKCLYCHNYVIAGHPEIQKEHYYFDTGTPVPWIKVNYLPEHVMFNHQRHIKKEIDCSACHGDIAAMDRIKGARFKMEFCIACHREKNVNLDCWLACHN